MLASKSISECSTSASTENSLLPEDSTASAQSYDEENSTTSDTTDKRIRESSPEEVSNGAIKKSRKKRNAAVPTSTGRGRPRKAFVAMYHSQISGDKNTIKIRIKKSNLSPVQVTFL